jgi:hypothetical protein
LERKKKVSRHHFSWFFHPNRSQLTSRRVGIPQIVSSLPSPVVRRGERQVKRPWQSSLEHERLWRGHRGSSIVSKMLLDGQECLSSPLAPRKAEASENVSEAHPLFLAQQFE